jgi:hypothetical protein
MAVALALGLRPGDVAVSGSGLVFAVSDAPVVDPSGTVAGFADATGRFLPVVHGPGERSALEALVPTTRVVAVPSDPALVAMGAAVQAAAVLGGLDPVAVAEAWATAAKA